MPRPKKCRFILQEPGVTYFKPQGIPLKILEQTQITVDELEAVRLTDYLGLSHEEAARQLQVSRPTVTRMLAKARKSIAEALVTGKAIRIEGGDYRLKDESHASGPCSPDEAESSTACKKCRSDDGEKIKP